MAQTYFITPKTCELQKMQDAAGYCNGKNIFINVFCDDNVYIEEDVEYVINYVFIHELIHLINFRLSEKKVTYISRKIHENCDMY